MDRRIEKNSEKKLSQSHFVHHKSHMREPEKVTSLFKGTNTVK
jgi:hypothetical protein